MCMVVSFRENASVAILAADPELPVHVVLVPPLLVPLLKLLIRTNLRV